MIPTPALSRASFDRAAHHRTDDAWLTNAWRSAAILVLAPDGTVPIEGSEDAPRLAFLGADEVPDAADRVFLGEDEKRSYFAVCVAAPAERGLGLRQIGALLDDHDAGLFVTAVALANWHRTHTHCPRCGTPTVLASGGWLRTCPSDGSEHYPRVDPAVIMLVHDGADRCLLGRQASWPEGRFSTLAGFVEPGESLEHAVAREVAEEAGIAVEDIRYRASQPWPFPSSLMLGFTARAVSADEPRLLDGELAEAKWFSQAELAQEAGPRLPPPISISQWLIATWLQAAPGA